MTRVHIRLHVCMWLHRAHMRVLAASGCACTCMSTAKHVEILAGCPSLVLRLRA